MSNRFSPKFAPIRFDPSGVFSPETGLSRDDQVALFPQLEAARAAVLIEMQGGKLPLLTLPERMLEEYGQRRHESELGRILAAAKRMRDAVDRVIIIGDESATLGARALFEACCHPYHNEQGRGDRGGRPRINFISPYEDNDALHGLIDLLETERPAKTIDRRWGIVAIDSLRQAAEANPALSVLLPRLRASWDDGATVAESVAFITHRDGWLANLSREFNGVSAFLLPESGDSRGEIASVIGLLPAAVMGIDVVRLLEGAAAMAERFRIAPIGNNPPLDFAGVAMCCSGSFFFPRFHPEQRSLQPFAFWCSQRLHHRIKRKPKLPIHVRKWLFSPTTLQIVVRPESLRRDELFAAGLQEHSKTVRESKLRASESYSRVVIFSIPAADEGALGQLMQMTTLDRELFRYLHGEWAAE